MTESEKNISGQRVEVLINGSIVQVDLMAGKLKPKVAFLGPRGTFTEEAVGQIWDGTRGKIEEELLGTNREVVRKVDSGEFDVGVVATENSTEGDVMETLRELVRAKNTKILGEIVIPINHVLIGRSKEGIRKVYSHPQALGQCSEYLNTNLPKAELIQAPSTGAAVDEIIKIDDAVAVGSRRLAEKYKELGLTILDENIGDNPNNATRFWLIGRGETHPTGKDKATVVFVTREDRVGMLVACLQVYALHGINLEKIDSHPSGELGSYWFRAVLTGHESEQGIIRSNELLRNEYCSWVRVLGSYKRAELPEGVKEPGVINGDGNGHQMGIFGNPI